MALSIHRSASLTGVPAWLSIPGWSGPDAAAFRPKMPVDKLVLKHQRPL
jgi:hypothetical protein